MLQENEIDCRPVVAGNFTRNPVMKHLKHAPLDPTPGADQVHLDGLFLGNHHYDLEAEILRASGVFQEFIRMCDEQ
jgi:CDP-6-deoxy-D-xylo-4-hexulose-3-dehydrase